MSNPHPPPGYVLKNRRTTLERVEKFISKTFFTNVNLFGKMYPLVSPVGSISHYPAPDRITYEEAMQGTYTPCNIGDTFGPTWSTHWFRIELGIPVEFNNKRVEFVWDSGSEAMIWKDGEAVTLQGINSSHEDRDSYILSEELPNTQRNDTIYVEMAANHVFGAGDGDQIFPTDPNRYFELKRCDTRTVNTEIYDLYCDFQTIIGYCKALTDSNRGYQALYTANEMVNVVDHNDPTTYQAARDLASAFFAQTNGATQHTVCAVGNCHIDTAWLWPYAETRRKCARSWSTSIRLIEKYPQFIFAASQAQQFEWVKQDYPGLFAEMQTHTATGKFYPVGGTWIEMDGNVPSGEGFIRQFLVGQRFFEQNFGSRCTEFWLPDTFGYSPQLPQIINLAGIQRFVTQKLSWSLVNKFPHNTFWWTGIDGTRVLSHFPPGDSYVMQGKAEEVKTTLDNFKDKGRSNVSLYLYGHGDGGQGPDAKMIERLNRMADVDGLPKVQLSTPSTFFDMLEAAGTDDLCEWKGELYLELHNGTYTTQAKIKKSNRQTEFLLCHAETVGTFARVLDAGATYPSAELLRLWKLVLLNQFHDVLPGTSIQLAHEAAFLHYEDVHLNGGILLTTAVDAFFNAQNDPSPVAQDVLFNLTSWNRTEVVTVPAAVAKKMTKKDTKALEQTDKDGNILVVADCPAMGYSKLVGLDVVNNQPTVVGGPGGSYTLDNGLVRADIDNIGRITFLGVNGGTKNAIAPGEFGNQLLLFDDIPLYWDAWDVMDYHLETRKEVSEIITATRIVESGAIRATLEVELRISDNSTIKQFIMLEAGSKCLKFDTQVNWNEAHKFLKVEFPVNASAQNATYECQYGFHQRPTHMNTSWEWAKYEVCGHKWADLSEYDWGLSVINDCKYGWSCIGNRLRLSLLRSPKNPDPTSDMGIQRFVYGACPHTGTFQEAGVIQAAWQLNVPLQLHNSQVSATVAASATFVEVDNPAIIVGALKMCEDDTNAFVVRLYEAYGGRGQANVKINNLPNGVVDAQLCNALEDTQGFPLIVTNDTFTLDFTPFQIVSVKVTFNGTKK